MFNKRLVAAAVLVLATTLSACGGSSSDSEGADTPKVKPTTSAATPLPNPTVGALTLTPATGVKDKQEVKLAIAGYGDFSGTAVVVVCTPAVLSDATNSAKYCDMRPESIGQVKVDKGSGTGTITMHVGADFKAGDPASKCDPGGKCLVLSSSTPENPKYVSFSEIAFAS